MCSGILLISLSRVGRHCFVQRLKFFLMLDDGLGIDLHSRDLDINASPFPRAFSWNNNMHHIFVPGKCFNLKELKQKSNLPSTGFSLSCSSCSCTAATQLVWMSSPSLFRSAMDLSTSSESLAIASNLDTEMSIWLHSVSEYVVIYEQKIWA